MPKYLNILDLKHQLLEQCPSNGNTPLNCHYIHNIYIYVIMIIIIIILILPIIIIVIIIIVIII